MTLQDRRDKEQTHDYKQRTRIDTKLRLIVIPCCSSESLRLATLSFAADILLQGITTWYEPTVLASAVRQ